MATNNNWPTGERPPPRDPAEERAGAGNRGRRPDLLLVSIPGASPGARDLARARLRAALDAACAVALAAGPLTEDDLAHELALEAARHRRPINELRLARRE